MRAFNRVIAASVATAVASLFLVIIPSTPASAANGIHTVNAGVTTVTEGQLATVTISLNAAPFPGETIQATVSTADGTARSGNSPADYSPNSQTVTFTCDGFNCPTTKNFTVQTLDDSTREPNETIRIVLSSVVNAAKGSDGTVTINDNEGGGVPTFTISDPAPAAEGTGSDTTQTVQVSLSPASNQTVTLSYSTADDTATASAQKGTPDYVAATNTLTWAPNTTDTKSIPLTIKGDALGEPTERFFVNFSNPNNASLPDNQAVVTITNDDGAAPVVTLAPTEPKVEGNAGKSDMIITINVTPAAPQIIMVDYTTADGTAVKDDDYTETKGTVTFSQGQGSKTVAVPIVGDQLAEPDETFTFTLTRATNATLGDPASQSNTIANDDFGQITTAPGAGRVAEVRLFGPVGAVLGGFVAYPAPYNGGANVARGDFFKADGSAGPDGIDEIVAGPGPNSNSRVLIFSPDGTIRANFFPFPGFPGGVSVAAGNLDADPANGDELVVGAGPGGSPHVRVLRVHGGASFTEIGGLYAYDQRFGGGVRVAAGDLVGDLRDEVIVAPGRGGGPHVKILATSAQGAPTLAGEFFAYDTRFNGGVFLASAGKKLITGPGPGGGPHVKVFTGAGNPEGGGFFAYPANFSGGVSVGAGNLDGDLATEIVTGAGPGGGPHVKAFDLNGSSPFGGGFFAYEPAFTGGVNVTVGNG